MAEDFYCSIYSGRDCYRYCVNTMPKWAPHQVINGALLLWSVNNLPQYTCGCANILFDSMKYISNSFSNFAIVLLYYLTTLLNFVEHVSCHSTEQEKSQTNHPSIKNNFSLLKKQFTIQLQKFGKLEIFLYMHEISTGQRTLLNSGIRRGQLSHKYSVFSSTFKISNMQGTGDINGFQRSRNQILFSLLIKTKQNKKTNRVHSLIHWSQK